METKRLSKPALEILEQYLNFKVGPAICSIPYFNNKKTGTRAAFRVHIGKGSPSDIRDELDLILKREKMDLKNLDNHSLKKLLTDKGLGIECSGYCYHILDTEATNRGLGRLSKKINFVNCKGFIGQLRCTIRPIENCDVETFADNTNSNSIPMEYVAPGDIITMIASEPKTENDHILLVHEVRYEKNIPVKIHYSHSIAYPEDGIYGTGVRTGEIEIEDIQSPLHKQNWIENGKSKELNTLFRRIQTQKTELRRLKIFK